MSLRRTLSIVNAYYKNGEMLGRQFAHLAGLPAELREGLQYLVCDDASPKGFRAPAPPEDMGLGLGCEVYRIAKKRPWNWIAARNIGAAHAAGDWLLFTDMDHMVSEAAVRRILEGKLDGRDVYRFARVDAPDLTPYKPHPNSWAMSRGMFDLFGGFDERYSGCYGSDGSVRNRLTALARQVVMLPEALIRVPREVVADASTTDFGRKGSEHNQKVAGVRERIEREGGPPLTMSFAYSRVG